MFGIQRVENISYYRAGGNGVLYTNKWISGENGVNYYGEDAKRCTGLQTINGIQYFFDSEGILIVSQAIVLDGVNYYCDANGIVHEMPNNQWYQSNDGDWYFCTGWNRIKGLYDTNCWEMVSF